MEKLLLISLRLPAADREYEVRLPAGLNAHLAALLTAQALEGLSEGSFRAAKSCVLAWRNTGRVLDSQRTIGENGVLNGSRLLLI